MITRDDVKKLAELARIDIAKEEEEGLLRDLDAVLEYVSEMKGVGVHEEGEPVAGELRNVMRDDGVPHEEGAHTEAILHEAPAREGDYVKVKQIL